MDYFFFFNHLQQQGRQQEAHQGNIFTKVFNENVSWLKKGTFYSKANKATSTGKTTVQGFHAGYRRDPVPFSGRRVFGPGTTTSWVRALRQTCRCSGLTDPLSPQSSAPSQCRTGTFLKFQEVVKEKKKIIYASFGERCLHLVKVLHSYFSSFQGQNLHLRKNKTHTHTLNQLCDFY